MFILGIRFCEFCAFSGFVLGEPSGWNGVAAMWSYVDKCHACQCLFSISHVFVGGLECSEGATGLQWFKFRALRSRRDVPRGKHGFWSRKAWTLVTDLIVPHPCAVCWTGEGAVNTSVFGHGHNMNDVLLPPPPPSKKTARSHQEVPKLAFTQCR